MTGRAIDRQRWALLLPQLDELMELPPDARALRLAELREQDTELAEDLTQLLTQMDGQEQDTFMRHTPELAQGLHGKTVLQTTGRAGDVVGAYRLERLLGEGGMGSVWLGRRIDGRYEGWVAIKFLRGGLSGAEHVRRFTHEGSLLARLDHPHIARLLDAGVTPAAQPYLVLAHVEGLAIDQYCAARELPLRSRLLLFMDVLAAVGHAHERLVLHRDLKPANILVTPQGQVKLLDFGIAKTIAEAQGEAPADVAEDAQASAGGQSTLASTARAFTPLFAAPEQLRGNEATTSTDVYALGVLLYTLLTGRHPTAEPGMTAPMRLQAVIDVRPRPMSEVVIEAGGAQARERSRELRGDLDTIAAKALSKQPAERYRAAADLADDVRRHLANEPIAARLDDARYTRYRAAKFVRRNRLAVAAAAAVVLALGAGAGAALLQAREARAQSAKAERQRLQAEGLVAFMLGDLREKLEPVGRLDVMDAVASRALAYYDAQADDSPDPEALARRAQALNQLGLLDEQRGRVDEAERKFRQAAHITQDLVRRFPRQPQRVAEHGDSFSNQAVIASHRLHYDEALADYREALAWQQRALALGPDDPKLRAGVADAWISVGVQLVDMGREEQALAPLTEGLARMLPLAPARPELWREVLNVRSSLGDAYYGLNRYAQAVEVLRPHWSALADVPGGAHDRELQKLRALGMNRLAAALLRLGQVDEADRTSREVVSQEAELVANEPANLTSLAALCFYRLQWGEALLAAQAQPRAEALLRTVATDTDRLLLGEPSSEEWQFNLKAWLLTLQATVTRGDPGVAKAAQAWIDDVVPRFASTKEGLGRYSLTMAAMVGRALGDMRLSQGRAADAQALWRQSAQRLGAPVATDKGLTLSVLAGLKLRVGDRAGAEALLARIDALGYRARERTDLERHLASAARR